MNISTRCIPTKEFYKKWEENGMALDYDGPMSYYQDQLTAHGIPKSELNMSDWVGLTADELQGLVDRQIIMHQAREVNHGKVV